MKSKIKKIVFLTLYSFTTVGMDTAPEPERNKFLELQLLHSFFKPSQAAQPFPSFIFSQAEKRTDIQKHLIYHCASSHKKISPLYVKHFLDCIDPSIRTVAYSPDGKQLATGGNQGTICIFDTGSGNRINAIQYGTTYAASINALKYSPDGKQLAVAGDDKNVLIFETVLGGCTHRLHHGETFAYSLAYSSDGLELATGGRDGKARIFAVTTGNLIATIDDGALIAALTFSPDNTQLATGRRSGFVHIFDRVTRKSRTLFDQGKLFGMAYTSNGKRLIMRMREDEARVFDIITGDIITCIKINYSDFIFLAAYSFDDNRLILGTQDGVLYIFVAGGATCIHTLKYKDYLFTSVASHPCSYQFAVGCNDKKTRVFDYYVPTTWGQIILLRMISLWLCVERPNKSINSVLLLLQKLAHIFSTHDCIIPQKYLGEIWNSLPNDVCAAVWDETFTSIKKYGKLKHEKINI